MTNVKEHKINSKMKTNKIVIFSIILMIQFFDGYCATYTSTANGGNWNSTSTWVGGVVPPTTENVVIATTSGNAVIVNVDNTICKKLTVNYNAILTISNTITMIVLVSNTGGTYSMTNSGTINGNLIISSNTREVDFVNNGTISIGGNVIVRGLCLFSNNSSVSITGNIEIYGRTDATKQDGKFSNNNGGTLNIGGTITLNSNVISSITYIGVFSASTASNLVNFNNSSNQNVFNTTYYNLEVSNGNTKSLTANTIINGSFTISTLTTLDVTASNYSLDIKSNFTNNGVINTRSGTVTFSGTAAQIINGSASTTFCNLIINNNLGSAGGLTLNLSPASSTNVSGALTLTKGKIITSATNILTLTASATSSVGTSTSFVSGPMAKTGTTAFIFPVGKGTKWARIGMGTPSASETFTAEYFNTGYGSYIMATTPLPVMNNVSKLEYWTLNRVGTATATVCLYSENVLTSGILDCSTSDLRIAHYNSVSGKWENNNDEVAVSLTGSCGTSSGKVIIGTTKDNTTFSPFTFGSKLANNPLPIELSKFTVNVCKKEVCINWTTLSETNNDFFTIERSKDGVTFEELTTIAGAGKSNSELNYLFTDKSPLESYSYYRLKQTDYNDVFSYSDIRTVNFTSESNFSMNIYPNPSNGNDFNILIQQNESKEVLVVVTDINGNEDYSKVILTGNTNETVYAIDPSKKLIPGVYVVNATSDNMILRKVLIVK